MIQEVVQKNNDLYGERKFEAHEKAGSGHKQFCQYVLDFAEKRGLIPTLLCPILIGIASMSFGVSGFVERIPWWPDSAALPSKLFAVSWLLHLSCKCWISIVKLSTT